MEVGYVIIILFMIPLVGEVILSIILGNAFNLYTFYGVIRLVITLAALYLNYKGSQAANIVNLLLFIASIGLTLHYGFYLGLFLLSYMM